VTVKEIIERHPRPINIDRDLLLRCIDACFDCAAPCTSCADACLGESDVPELVRCVRLNLDCADVCDAQAVGPAAGTAPSRAASRFVAVAGSTSNVAAADVRW
jgi:hypothetical protein